MHRRPRAGLDGPSRTIIVEPATAPVPERPEPERAPDPRPELEPEPEKVPA